MLFKIQTTWPLKNERSLMSELEVVREQIAQTLIELGCLSLSPLTPFTYASGLKGPIYCDNRKLLAHPKARNKIVDAFIFQIEELKNQKKLSFDIVAGLATAGIPHAAWIADRMHLPMAYVRSKPKEHGKQNQVEGAEIPGAKVLLIEDLINQGKSLNDALLGLQNAHMKAEICLCIVNYGMPNALAVALRHQVEIVSLTDLDVIVKVAKKMKAIDEKGEELIKEWKNDPKGQGAIPR